jgi:ABC-type molybdate transport system substrate-binding protein
VAIILGVLLWPSGSGAATGLPPTRARVYAAWRACLVTGPAGIGDAQAASVWAGMEQASAKTSAKVSYLAAVGDGSAGEASTYVATAAGEQCDLVIAVGAPEVQGVAMVAREFPGTRFAVVGGGGVGGNVTQISVSASGSLTASVESAVQDAFEAPAPSAAPPTAPSGAPQATETAR